MPMNIMIRERRKALGLTQGQVAEHLGVSAPAVSKWESGTAYPDITLLPALARFLQTDPNSLMCFQQEPSSQEIQQFVLKTTEILQEKKGLEGIQESSQFMEMKLQEYPHCTELLHTFALILDGSLLMSTLSPEEKKPYEELALFWYRQVVEEDDGDRKIRAAHMLAVKYMNQEAYAKAQELIDLMPEHDLLDKQLLQADLILKQGDNLKKAEKLIQRKLYHEVMNLNGILLRLVKVLLAEEDSEKAARVADLSRGTMELLGYVPYFAQIAPLEVALAKKDKTESLRLIRAFLEAVTKESWQMADHPLYDQLPEVQVSGSETALRILPPLIANLDQAPEFDFLREEREFQSMLKRYREHTIR